MSSITSTSRLIPPPRPTVIPQPPQPPPRPQPPQPTPTDGGDEPSLTTTSTTTARTTTTSTLSSSSSSSTTTTTSTTSLSTTTTTAVTIRPQVPTQAGSGPTDLTRNLGPGASGDSLTESSSSILPMILMIGGGLVLLIACIVLAVHFYRKRTSSRNTGSNAESTRTRKIKLPGKPVLRPTPMDPSTPAVTRPNSTFLTPLGSYNEPIPPMPPVPATLHQQMVRPPSFHPPPPPNSHPPTLPGRIIPIAALPALGAMDPRAFSPRLSYTPTSSTAGSADGDDFSLQSLVDAWLSVATHLDAYVRRESNVLASLDRTTGNPAMDLAIVNRVRVQRAERLAGLATQVVQQLETGLAVGDLRTFTLEATDVLQRVARVYPDMQLFVPRAGMRVRGDEVEVYHHDDAYGESGGEAGQVVRCAAFPGWREARTGRIIVRAKVLTEC